MSKHTREPKTCKTKFYLIRKITPKHKTIIKTKYYIPTTSTNFSNNTEISKEKSMVVPTGSLELFQEHPIQVTGLKLSVPANIIDAYCIVLLMMSSLGIIQL